MADWVPVGSSSRTTVFIYSSLSTVRTIGSNTVGTHRRQEIGSTLFDGDTGAAVDGPDAVIRRDRQDRVAVITLNRPDKRNALTVEACHELRGAIAAELAAGARALVLTGPDRFCSGADLDEVYTAEFLDALYAMLHAVADAPVPVIAAVNGRRSAPAPSWPSPPTCASPHPARCSGCRPRRSVWPSTRGRSGGSPRWPAPGRPGSCCWPARSSTRRRLRCGLVQRSGSRPTRWPGLATDPLPRSRWPTPSGCSTSSPPAPVTSRSGRRVRGLLGQRRPGRSRSPPSAACALPRFRPASGGGRGRAG